MKMKTWRMRYLLTAGFAVVAVVIIMGAAGRRRIVLTRSAGPPRHQEQQRVERSLPSVISTVKKLKIARVFFDDQKLLNIVLLNETGKGIQSFAVSSGTFMVITDDGLISDNPKTIIEPNSTYAIQLPVSNLEENIPVVISAVLYDDDTEDGDKAVRQKIRDARHREKEKRLSAADDNKER